jgi:hypothetical protein
MSTPSNPVASYFLQATPVVAIVTVIVGWLPPITAFVALVWYMIQISESKPVKRWRHRRAAIKLARLKARVMMLEAKTLPLPEDLKDLDSDA